MGNYQNPSKLRAKNPHLKVQTLRQESAQKHPQQNVRSQKILRKVPSAHHWSDFSKPVPREGHQQPIPAMLYQSCLETVASSVLGQLHKKSLGLQIGGYEFQRVGESAMASGKREGTSKGVEGMFNAPFTSFSHNPCWQILASMPWPPSLRLRVSLINGTLLHNERVAITSTLQVDVLLNFQSSSLALLLESFCLQKQDALRHSRGDK